VGLIFRKRVQVGDTAVNFSGTGASVSRKVGRFITLNSRGRVSVRLLPGLSWRLGGRRRR
jgi:hypothetical protein